MLYSTRIFNILLGIMLEKTFLQWKRSCRPPIKLSGTIKVNHTKTALMSVNNLYKMLTCANNDNDFE